MTDTSHPTSAFSKIIIVVLCLIVGVQGYYLYRAYASTPEERAAAAEMAALQQQERDALKAEQDRRIAFDRPEELTQDRLDTIVMRNCSLTPYTIEGTSLEPAYSDGTRHVFFTGDKCPITALIEKEKVVILNTGQADLMVSKLVKAVPGDTFALSRRAGQISVLTINGEDVKNSVGRVYSIPRDRQSLIALYIKNYKGIVPQNSYLLLGDDVNGSLDSTRFGLANIKDIHGIMRDEDVPEESQNTSETEPEPEGQ